MENEGLDIARVVGLIMENPQLIEQIAALAKPKDTAAPKEVQAEPVTAEPKETEKPVPTYTLPKRATSKRTQLFGALKPYLSEERARAMDSMMAIADILDMMKAR